MGVSKYNNEMKAYCLDYGVLDFVKNKRKELYKNKDTEGLLFFESFVMRDELADCSSRLLESKYRKYCRARKHIEKIIEGGNAVFVTLTFTNEVLSSTSAETRRRYVARYLKEQSAYYVANIDYSPNKEREHYHAVVFNPVNMNAWTYGFTWCERIHISPHNTQKVSQYLVKLTSHAFKVNSTRLLYSRIVLE